MTKVFKSKILCVGDIILDSYIHGKVERISPEAPIPILKISSEDFVLGGAANVARNVCAGNGICHLISIVGKDKEANILKRLIKKEKDLSVDLIIEKDRKTTTKKRYISGQQQVLRVDCETVFQISRKSETRILSIYEREIKKFNVVIISDYNKGLLSYSLTQSLIAIAKKYKKPIIVDPKRDSFSIYKEATILTPNLNELFNVKNEVTTDIEDETKKIEILSRKLIERYSFDCIITTRSSNGMVVTTREKKVTNLTSDALEVFDVSGAGDTVIAYLSLGLSEGLSIEQAASKANKAAGIAVGKLGTASVNEYELKNAGLEKKKIFLLSDAKEKIKSLKNKKIGFTNGCFDLIHSGHVSYLSESRRNCDFLILGLNSDHSIKKIKGGNRPINSEEDRLIIISNFLFIDMVILFNELTPLKLIKSIKPDIIFKGSDYRLRDVIGLKEVRSWGGEVKLIDFKTGKSSTNLIKRIKNES